MIHRTEDPRCSRMRVRLSGRHDGEIAADRSELELSGHLAACPACRDFERELRELSARLAVLRGAAPPPDLWPRVAARVAPPAARPALARWSARAAAALLGFLGVALAERALGGSAPSEAPDDLLRPFTLLASLADAGSSAPLPPENQLVRALRGPEEDDR
jgi:anti-sigma factor RsiW